MRAVLVLVALTVATLAAPPPAAAANPAGEAPADWVQKGACPFECCRYGRWTAQQPLGVVDAPARGARKITEIASGATFTAVTGETHTVAGILRLAKPLGARPAGDRVFVYDYVGEGFYRAWIDGGMKEIEIMTTPFGASAERATGTWEREPEQTWWVKVRLRNGAEGWIEMPDTRAVTGHDGCG